MIIDRGQPIPLYFQLKTHLLEEILGGTFGPDDRLPTEHELCERFGVSRTPVTRALTELADEGVIIRHRRRGSFVNPHWLTRRPPGPEVRLLLPDGPWADIVRHATSGGPNLNIATVSLADLLEVVRRAVGEGRAPDLALVDSVWVPELAAAGSLWPLDELDREWFDSDYIVDFVEPLVAANRFQGRSYGIQAESDVAGLWIRRDHLERVGHRPPATWEDIEGLASALAEMEDRPAYPLVLPGGSRGGETTTYCLLALLASNGIEVILGETITLDDRRAVAALRFLRGLLDRGLISPEVVSYEWDRPIRMVATGEASMSFGGSYEGRLLADLNGIELDALDDHYMFLPVPTGPAGTGTTLTGGMAYVIFRQAHQPKEAMRLLEQLLAPDALVHMALETGQLPPRRSAAEAVGTRVPFLARTTAMLSQAVMRPPIPAHARVSRQLQAMLEGVLTGRFGPAAAVERTAELLSAITGLEVA